MTEKKKTPIENASEFMFGVHTDEPMRNLNPRTDVTTRQVFEMLDYYDVLERLGSKAAAKCKDGLEELLISIKRGGRVEGLEFLKVQVAPKVQKLYQAVEQQVASEESPHDQT